MDLQDKPKKIKTMKVGVLGDQRVGKTYLSHKLSGKSYQNDVQTTQINHNSSNNAQQQIQFLYAEYPCLDNEAVIIIGSVYHYDMLIFVFKDCDSFTKLYEFLVVVKEGINSCKNAQVRYYWQHLKKVLLVYSDFQCAIPVQLGQLFPILKEEISSFCLNAVVKEFSLKVEAENYMELKDMIESEPVFMEINEIKQENKQEGIGGEQTWEERQKLQLQGQGIVEENQQKKHQQSVQIYQGKEGDKMHEQDRKSKVYQIIQRSFFSSSVIDQSVHEDVPTQYIQANKTSNVKKNSKEKETEVEVEVPQKQEDPLKEQKETQAKKEKHPADSLISIPKKKPTQEKKVQPKEQQIKKQGEKKSQQSNMRIPLRASISKEKKGDLHIEEKSSDGQSMCRCMIM